MGLLVLASRAFLVRAVEKKELEKLANVLRYISQTMRFWISDGNSSSFLVATFRVAIPHLEVWTRNSEKRPKKTESRCFVAWYYEKYYPFVIDYYLYYQAEYDDLCRLLALAFKLPLSSLYGGYHVHLTFREPSQISRSSDWAQDFIQSRFWPHLP